jgi:hypothetical protein
VIAAVAMVKNVADIVEPVLRHVVGEGADLVMVADNVSTDGTRAILDGLAADLPIEVVDHPLFAFDQAAVVTSLAVAARRRGADWIVPIDGDEVWYSTAGTIAEALEDFDGDVMEVVGWDHVTRDLEPVDLADPIGRMPWRRPEYNRNPKVVFRPIGEFWINEGNHSVELDGRPPVRGPIQFRNFPFRSFEQMRWKVRHGAAAYAAAPDVAEMHGLEWRQHGARSDTELVELWAEMCRQPDLVHDPAPLRA